MLEHRMDHDPWITLAIAVVYQAVLDAQNGHPALANEAKIWLQFIGVSWCEILDVSEKELKIFSLNDLKLPENTHRNWRY